MSGAASEPNDLLIVMPSGLRRTLIQSRLSSVGLITRCIDDWPAKGELNGDARALLLTDIERAARWPGGGRWIEVLDEPCDALPAEAARRIGRFRIVPPDLDTDALARLAAPDDAADSALNPAQWQTLDALAERAPERVRSLLSDYVARSEGRRERLREFVAAGNAGILGAAAHAWKGAAAGVGADRLADALQRLESLDDTMPPRVEITLAVAIERSHAADAALLARCERIDG